mgnify:CR=1 FL=1
MEEEKTIWDNLVNAFLEDLKQHPIDQSLYAFATAYNIAMKEMEVEESDKEYYDYVNAKTDLIWEEIGNIKDEYYRLRERVRQLEENRPQVQPPSKMYPDWNKPDWTPYNPVPPWTVTCSYGNQPLRTTFTGDVSKCAFNNVENGPAVTGTIKHD